MSFEITTQRHDAVKNVQPTSVSQLISLLCTQQSLGIS